MMTNTAGTAIAEYESTIRDFPTDAFARTGRADVLKVMGRFPEALAEYESTIRDFPTEVVPRTGKATLLTLLKRYEEARALLSEDRTAGLHDWVSEHLRGMIALRSGRTEEAIEVFERGERECPWLESRNYFRSALAIARLRQHGFASALARIESQTDPVCDVLKFHAYGALGRVQEAKSANERLLKSPFPLGEDLRRELVSRYLETPGKPNQSDDWVLDQECFLRLAA